MQLPATSSAASSPGKSARPRLLKLFERFAIKASWFIPGHSIETFPDETRMIAAAGYEIGAHGYSHENSVAMTRRQKEDLLKKSIELIEKYSGKKPRGCVAPRKPDGHHPPG